MSVNQLRQKIASHFNTDPLNLEIKIGASETKFDGTKPKEEVQLQIFKDLSFSEE